MPWVPEETELTTAATDVLLAAVAVFCVVRLLRPRHDSDIARGTRAWSTMFGCLAVAAILGSLVHGVIMDPALTGLLGAFLHLSLGLALASVGIGAMVDLLRRPPPRGVTAAFVTAGIGVTLLTLWSGGSTWIRSVFGAGVLGFAWIVYARILVRRREAFAAWMFAGIAVSIVGAALQASGSVHVQMRWRFDHNGVFHLIQIVGMVLLLAGARQAPRSALSALATPVAPTDVLPP